MKERLQLQFYELNCDTLFPSKIAINNLTYRGVDVGLRSGEAKKVDDKVQGSQRMETCASVWKLAEHTSLVN